MTDRCPYKQGLSSEVQCVLTKGHAGKHLWHPEPAVPPVPAGHVTYEDMLTVLREYAIDQKVCGYPARMQDLREFRRWKNMPQDAESDAKLLTEVNGVPAEPRSAEAFKTVTDHKFIAQECHDSGCQFLVLREQLAVAEKVTLAERRHKEEFRDIARTSLSKLAAAEHWKDDWFTKLSAIEKRAETAEAALLSAQKEIALWRGIIEELDPLRVQPPYDHDGDCSYCGTMEGIDHPRDCTWERARAALAQDRDKHLRGEKK